LSGGEGSSGASGRHDHIDLHRDEFGSESGEPLGFSLGIPIFDHDVASLDVTEIPQALKEGLSVPRVAGRQVGREVADSSNLHRLLRRTGERANEHSDSEADRQG